MDALGLRPSLPASSPGPATTLSVVPPDEQGELTAILDAAAIRSVYQPLVEIETGGVIGFEALARGPEGSPLARPDLLFAAAAASGRTTELEWACRTAALVGALDAGIGSPGTLFVNVEPSSLVVPEPPELARLMTRALERMPVVLELTERALIDDPNRVLEAVRRYRAEGFSIALDDVGADRRSMALIPFVAPEVIKLDLRLVQSRPSASIAGIVHAVNAEAQRSGALLLAEGVETEDHEELAVAFGARAAQGWRYGRPAPLGSEPKAVAFTGRRAVHPPAMPAVQRTPFQVVAEHVDARIATKQVLVTISRHLEMQVVHHDESAVLVATFQRHAHFTEPTRTRYEQLGAEAAFVGAFAVDMPAEPVAGVRGVDLDADEPLAQEWDVVVVDPHFAAAFVAQDLGDRDRPDLERRFRFCLTYDRELAVQAARSLLRRVSSDPG